MDWNKAKNPAFLVPVCLEITPQEKKVIKNKERGEWTGEEKKAALLGFTLAIVQILFLDKNTGWATDFKVSNVIKNSARLFIQI